MAQAITQRVVVLDHAFASVSDEQAVAQAHGASFECFSCITEADAEAAATGADVAFVNFAPVTEQVLRSMRPGGLVIRYGIGYDNVDIDAARAIGVHVANVPDYGVQTVADHAAASLVALGRRLIEYDRRIRTDGWIRPTDIGHLRGFRSMTVGLIGLGRIAQAVVTRLAPFGFTFVAFDPHCPPRVFHAMGVQEVDLAELASRSNAVSVHAPSTPESYRMIDAAFLSALPHGAIVVNTSRGPLIDEAALTNAIVTGHVAAAALDVFDPEPPAVDSPLRNLPQVLFTPHAAFYDDDSLAALQRLASEEAGRALRGEALRCAIV